MATLNNIQNNKRKILYAGYMLIFFALLIIIGPMLHLKSAMISYLLEMDLTIFNFINTSMSNAAFDSVMPWLTYLGGFWTGWIFIIILFIINLKPIKKGLKIGLFLLFIYGCASGLNYIIKYLVNRPRPFVDHEVIVRAAYPPTDPGFPSGHAATVFVIATILSYQFPKYKYVFYGFACLVGFSRIYLGVHYFSDVAIGALIGYGITRLIIMNKFYPFRKNICPKTYI